MIAINKTEKNAIIARFPNAHIVRTAKQKSKRHHYYCEETSRVVRFLDNLRKTAYASMKAGDTNKYNV